VASARPFRPPRAWVDRVCQTPGRGMTPLTTPASPAAVCWSPFVHGRMSRRSGDRVLLLAIPIQLMLSPVPVPPRLERLDVGGGHSGKTSQRQERGPDRHPGRRSTMMGLAMRTPHHRRQDLPRAAYVLERGIQSVTEHKDGLHGHRRIGGLPEYRDHLWKPDLLGIAGSHHHPLPCLGILCAFPPLRMVGVRQAPERSARRRSCSVQRPARRCKREIYAHVPRLDEHTILAYRPQDTSWRTRDNVWRT